jgi:hypothetical protein
MLLLRSTVDTALEIYQSSRATVFGFFRVGDEPDTTSFLDTGVFPRTNIAS